MHISLYYHLEDNHRHTPLDISGSFMTPLLKWRPYIGYLAQKCRRVIGILRRQSNHRKGVRTDTPIVRHRTCIRPVLEFECTLLCHALAYRAGPVVSWHCSCTYFGLSQTVANIVLYLLIRTGSSFDCTDVLQYLWLITETFGTVFISQPACSLSYCYYYYWPWYHTSEVTF